MKIRAPLLLSALAALPSLSGASAPTDPTVRGQMDAMFAFCLRLNPAGQESYRRLQKSVMGLPADATSDAIESKPQSRQAFEFVSGALDHAPRAEAIATCRSVVNDKAAKEDKDGGKDRDRDRH